MPSKKQDKQKREAWEAVLLEDRDFLKGIVRGVLQEFLEFEMEEALQAGKSERTESRVGYRSGYYGRTLVTRASRCRPP